MKKGFLYVIIIILLIAIPIALFYLAVISGAIFSLMPNPPEPAVTYGEFPIQVTFEVDGEVKTVEDVIICEYDGIKSYGSGGKQRQWKSRLKSGNASIVLVRNENEILTYEITKFYGFAEYYMGDFLREKTSYEEMIEDKEVHYRQWKNGEATGEMMDETTAWEKLKFRIIDIQYAEPIVNTFE